MISRATSTLVFASLAASSGCSPRAPCEDEHTRFLIGTSECDADDCVLDFGTLSTGESATLRLVWTGRCAQFIHVEPVVRNDPLGVFLIEPVPRHAERGFAFVEAHHVNDEPYEASLEVAIGSQDFTLPLLVNVDGRLGR